MNEDPVQRAVDEYILMERKARAWDALIESVSKELHPGDPIDIAFANFVREVAKKKIEETK